MWEKSSNKYGRNLQIKTPKDVKSRVNLENMTEELGSNKKRKEKKKRLLRLSLRGFRKCGCLRTSERLWAHTTGSNKKYIPKKYIRYIITVDIQMLYEKIKIIYFFANANAKKFFINVFSQCEIDFGAILLLFYGFFGFSGKIVFFSCELALKKKILPLRIGTVLFVFVKHLDIYSMPYFYMAPDIIIVSMKILSMRRVISLDIFSHTHTHTP